MEDVLTINGFKYARVRGNEPASEREQQLAGAWVWMVDFMEEELRQAKEIHEENQKLGLSANAVEAEGYLRAMMAIKYQIDLVKEDWKL